MAKDKLAKFLQEVSNWNWEEFAKAEKNRDYTSNEAIIFALVRACALQNMSAIRVAVNRLDGKLKTPIKIEYPKIYYLYPNATLIDETMEQPKLEQGEFDEVEVVTDVEIIEPEVEEEVDLPSMGFRQTLARMSDYPRDLPDNIIMLALQTEQALRGQAVRPDEIPRVKSVVAAHLLKMAQARNMDAIGEVFDAIDGKLVETLHIIGEDIYITSYVPTAPPGATLNKDGVLQAEATIAQDLWAAKLGRDLENG